MANKLVIVESPSKAKTIKKFLGKNYEVIASQGHIIDLPASKLGIDIDNDFEPQYIVVRGKAKIVKQIKDEAKKADQVYLATDPDREGEAIAWHISNTLNIDKNKKCRIEFNEITENTVKEAVKKPRTLDLDLVNAQQARRILDRIVGYKLSPVLWKKVKSGLSAGRVQSVTLRIIMDRERQIRDFKPEEYWLLTAKLKKDGENKLVIAKFYGDNKGEIKLNNKQQVDDIIKKIDNQDYIVKDVKKSVRKKNPAPPFTTSSMQQEASRKLGYSVKKTMMLAQRLYEAGYITYMRTDSTRISEEARAAAKKYIVSSFGTNYYENRYYKAKAGAQDAHEAIRPTKIDNLVKLADSLEKDEKRLYSLIYHRFLASQMTSAVYDTTKIIIDVNNYTFVANGSILRFDGFMKLYIENKDEESKDDDEYILPEIEAGDKLKQKELIPEQKFTEPPARYTEASLVKCLEEKGIGRPSTYAPTISTLLDRVYVEKDKKYLVPTKLGEIVDNLLEKNFKDIVDIKFTADMENQLDEIAQGHEDYIKMLKDFYTPFITNLNQVEDKIEKVQIPVEMTDIKCELCGRNMVIKQGRYGKFLACSGYPECKNAKPIVRTISEPCPKCGGKVLIKKTKKGRIFYVCENSPKTCDYISWTKPGVEVKAKAGYKSKGATIKKSARKTTTKKTSKKTSQKATISKSKTKKTSKK